MKEKAVDMRVGWLIEHEGKRFVVLNTRTVKSGTGGGAFIQAEMRNLESGSKTQAGFRTTDSIERLSAEDVPCTFIYKEGENFVFMNSMNYEQVTLSPALVGDDALFLTDGMEVQLKLIEGEPVGISLPSSVVCTVVEADPQIKGATVNASTKKAVLDNGLTIDVPSFINVGDRIVIKTGSREYSERFKEKQYFFAHSPLRAISLELKEWLNIKETPCIFEKNDEAKTFHGLNLIKV